MYDFKDELTRQSVAMLIFYTETAKQKQKGTNCQLFVFPPRQFDLIVLWQKSHPQICVPTANFQGSSQGRFQIEHLDFMIFYDIAF